MADKKLSYQSQSALRRFVTLHLRLLIAVAVGLAFMLGLLAVPMGAIARLLAGWDLGIAIYMTLILRLMWHADVARIRARAAYVDEGASAILILSVIATFASLIAIGLALIDAKHGNGPLAVGLAIATIVLSWAFVHTIFSFHYAHEYYGSGRDGRRGGLEFPGDKAPDYRDFLYFSLVIGMTSQVSDVQISSKVIRRLAAAHGVLSFFFNLVVLALTINVVANLI
ncbi:MAG: DUF1345 domain-containing protein [Proteobacteria bacterium]|nr:DUF1345 domain-containing protein [Pseudomonadota bacterium]